MADQEAQTASFPQHTLVPWRVRLCRWLWKAFTFLGVTVILSSLVGIGDVWLTSSKGKIPADSPFGWLISHWLVVLLIGCCCVLIAIMVGILSRGLEQTTPSVSLIERDRVSMLVRLSYIYRIALTHSLNGAAWMNLGFLEQPEAVHNATRLLLHTANQLSRLLPEGTSILQIYNDVGQELLILGEPGAGKSTLLLTLAQQLIEQAKTNANSPLPVIFLLSSWADKRLLLQEWLCEQLVLFYNVPKSLAQRWIQQKQILPLLDGLDEMDVSERSYCIAAINAYHHRDHLAPLVVCSRKNEYAIAAKRQRLSLQYAVEVQPLTHSQVDVYLTQAGKPLEALRNALKKNAVLRELATTPLMLSILMLTYQGTSVRNLSHRSTYLRQQVWTDYTQRMVNQKGNNERYPLRPTSIWLHWLAQQMRVRNQTALFLEQLQPDWLPKRQRFLYRLSVALVIMLIVLLFEQLVWVLESGLFSWMLKGLFVVPLGGLLGALPEGLIGGLSFGLFFGWRTIQPSEVLNWSWKNFLSRLLYVLFIGLGGGGGLLLKEPTSEISGEQLTERLNLFPNEGIRRSAKNGLFVWLIIGPFVALLVGLFFGLVQVPIFGLFEGLFDGLFFGLLAGLYFGLGAFIQHYVLRFWLWRADVFPWNAVRFLDDATARILLRRLGGGYSFAHRLLLDYFADLDTKAASNSSKID